MKKVLLSVFTLILIQVPFLYGQIADPFISIQITPVVLSLNGIGVLNVDAGNAGNSTIVTNSLRIELLAGLNAEITGFASNLNSDTRWTINSGLSTIGVGNTVIIENSGGGFSSFDISQLYFSVVGRIPSEPVLLKATIDYIPGGNVLLGGLPNSSQGDAGVNNYSQSSVSVSYALEDCANGIDDDADGFFDCQDSDCSFLGIEGGANLSVTPSLASFCAGDSVVLTPTITNLPISHPDIWYQWSDGTPFLQHTFWTTGGLTVLSPGMYSVTVTNLTGCHLIVDSISVTVTTIDPSVTQTNATLTAAMPDAEYQWIDCNTAASPIAGATGQVFNPTQNGSYAVVVTKNGCSETSNCSIVNTVGTASIEKENGVTIYPNPFADELYLTFEKEQTDTKVNIFGMDGKLMLSNMVSGSKAIIETQHLPKGMCFVQLIGVNEATVFKMIKY